MVVAAPREELEGGVAGPMQLCTAARGEVGLLQGGSEGGTGESGWGEGTWMTDVRVHAMARMPAQRLPLSPQTTKVPHKRQCAVTPESG